MVSLRLMVVFARRKAAFRDLRNLVWEFYKGINTIRANIQVTKLVGRLEREFDPKKQWMLADMQELIKTWRAIDRNELNS